MLADGNGDYARALGLELDARGFGMGMRGQRFAIVVDNGVATHVDVEAPGQFKVSAEHVLRSCDLAHMRLLSCAWSVNSPWCAAASRVGLPHEH